MNEPIKTRDPEEIQKLHDVIKALLNLEAMSPEGDLVAVPAPEVIERYQLLLDFLCWILKHENGNEFGEAMIELQADLFGKGIEFYDTRKGKND